MIPKLPLVVEKKTLFRKIMDREELEDIYYEDLDSRQIVEHTHLYLIGGRRMSWPPG